MNRLFFECFYFALYEFGELLGLGQFYEVFIKDYSFEFLFNASEMIVVLTPIVLVSGINHNFLSHLQNSYLSFQYMFYQYTYIRTKLLY